MISHGILELARHEESEHGLLFAHELKSSGKLSSLDFQIENIAEVGDDDARVDLRVEPELRDLLIDEGLDVCGV
jgi:hypothetical protein